MRLAAALASLVLVAAAPLQRVVIDGDYGPHVVFVDRFTARETVTSTAGVPKGFAPSTDISTGTLRIRHLAPQGKYLVSKADGSYVETLQSAGTVRRSSHKLDARSEFDELGYSGTGPTDPANLIPIFPGRPVSTGDSWSVTAPVTSPYGTGSAHYVYHVTRVQRDTENHAIADFSVSVRAALAPHRNLAGWRAELTGEGTIEWDCTAHQRRSSFTRLEYHAFDGARAIADVQTERDTMRATMTP